MSIHSNEPSCPLSKRELVSCKQLLLLSVENTNLLFEITVYTGTREIANWTPPIPHKGCSRGPNPRYCHDEDCFYYHSWGNDVVIANHYVKLGQKRRESSKRNYYIFPPKVITKAIIIIVGNSLVFSYLASRSEWRCLRCLSCMMKNWRPSCRSSVIGMRSYPPQYPRSTTPTKSIPPLLPFLSLSFTFSNFFSFFLFSFLPIPPFLFPYLFLVLIFVCVSSHVCACIFGLFSPAWWQQ